MSPEQARGAGEVDARADVWSLGVVLYELLSGRKPFEGEQFLQVIYEILSTEPPPLARRAPGLPPKLVAAVERAHGARIPGGAGPAWLRSPRRWRRSAVRPRVRRARSPRPAPPP